MKFIPPLEISSKIMTLIEESNKELILVSPYVEISKWDKMKKCIERAVNRNVRITFIARKNAKQDLTFLEQLGINLILINDLHAKLYLNENYGILTSQNIVYYSDINSIDIAYQTDNTLERKELVVFVNKYILNIENTHKNILNVVDNNDYRDIFPIKDWELEKLSNYFVETYYDVKFVTTFSYVFSGHLLPFADVMISSQYTIKFRKTYKDCEKLIDEISKIKFSFKNDFRIDLRTSHKTFYYLEFVPTKKSNINNLIADYQMITQQMLNNAYIKGINSERQKSGNDTKFFN